MHWEVVVSRQPLPSDAHWPSCPDPHGSFTYSSIHSTILFCNQLIPTSLLVFPTFVLSRGPESARAAVERRPRERQERGRTGKAAGMWPPRRCSRQAGRWGFHLPPSWILCASASSSVEENWSVASAERLQTAVLKDRCVTWWHNACLACTCLWLNSQCWIYFLNLK